MNADQAQSVPVVCIGVQAASVLQPLLDRGDDVAVLVVDSEDRLAGLGESAQVTKVSADVRRGLPEHVMDLATGGVVVCAETLDRWPGAPRRLLRDLTTLRDRAALIVVTSARTDVLTGERWDDSLRGRLAPGDPRTVVVAGALARRPSGPPASLLAVVTCFNEEDIIEATVAHLLGQGADVHVIDNWSFDGSWDLLNQLAETTPNVTLERWPVSEPSPTFELHQLLSRIEEVALATPHEWILHNDADELRQTPWPDVTVAQALGAIERFGYTAVDFSLLDFRPTEEGFARGADPLTFFRWCELANQEGYTHQIRAWRQPKGERVVLAPGAGHDPRFEGRRVFPLNLITRHYSLRSPTHAATKLRRDRIPRLAPAETEIGWHGHLHELNAHPTFLWSPDDLLAYDDRFVSEHLLALLARVGAPTPQ